MEALESFAYNTHFIIKKGQNLHLFGKTFGSYKFSS